VYRRGRTPLAERLRQREPAEIKKPPLLTPLSLYSLSRMVIDAGNDEMKQDTH
jgi:hypothetical protein